MELGRTREKRIANSLDLSDISTICATLEFFGVERPQVMQSAWDLRVPKYRVFDWLATNLDRCMHEKQENDNSNVWVALGKVYLNTTSPGQFVEALRFMDLQLWEGNFTSDEFAKDVREWNDADIRWKQTEEFKKSQRVDSSL